MLRLRKPLAVLVMVLAVSAAVLVLQGCSRPPSKSATLADVPTAPPEATTDNAAKESTAARMGKLNDGKLPLHVSKTKVVGDEVAVITTDKGVIEFTFFPKDAPNTVASFIELADLGFYDGVTFWRVEPDFVIQGGDPNSVTEAGPLGTGGPGWVLKDEFNKHKHVRGTVAMAHSSAPDSAGSQFYITLSPQPRLDNLYTVFGQVTKGLDVLDKITVGTVMKSVRIVHSGK